MVRKEAKARRSSSKIKGKRASRPVEAPMQVCNVDLLQRALKWIVGDVTKVFVSHGHGDHALGWPMFRLWWALHALEGEALSPPQVVASDRTWQHLRALWEHSYNDIP